ncbi:unnamed protein product [Ranitomeya imitator]|uniref:SNF2 N-terminal domain-containing protein n=1 Tax=Ranitomeya imitator TaxID=111125 RepID=A0ABN9LG77_9NEOB|nr:unnamed protein product [Ranitomeya imitator]
MSLVQHWPQWAFLSIAGAQAAITAHCRPVQSSEIVTLLCPEQDSALPGRGLKVVSFLHTVLLNDQLDFSTALVVCPLNTVLNWTNEFEKWQDGLNDDEALEVCELATIKRPQERGYMLQRWHDNGGVLIIGYEMYRNLTQGRNVKSKKLKELYQKTLVDPGNINFDPRAGQRAMSRMVSYEEECIVEQVQ